ncbi:MAG: methyltransferase family protein [Armatimonadota bacterium]
MTREVRPAPERRSWWKGTRGEWWVIGQGVLMAALAVAPAVWRWTAPARALWVTLGVALVLAGIGLAVRAVIELGPNLTALPRPRRRGVLVQTGVYALVRHPIYGGLIIAAGGWALWRASGLHLLLAGVFAVYMNAKSLHEETLLLEVFPEYLAYRQRTKRLIPWLF